MTIKRRLVQVLGLTGLGLLAACGPTPQDDAAAVELVRGSRAGQDMLFRDCHADLSRNSAAQIANLAAIANTTPARAPRVVCQRMVAGIVSGRLTPQDITRMRRGQVTPELVRIVQGR